MARIYQMICALMILALLGVGIVSLVDKDLDFSETEGRSLKTFPKITVSSFLDGGFWSDLETYYADTFPGRENLVESYRSLDGFYGLDAQSDKNQ